MMTIKHLIAGAVVTAAVTSALVLGSAVTAQASIFPPPTPIGPGKVDLPIYTQPSLPGFHLPKELWTKYGPQVQPKRPHPYTHALGCPDVFTPYATAALAREGYVLTSDSAIHVTTDPQLVALLTSGPSTTTQSISCRWVQTSTGAIVDVTTAINVNDEAFTSRLRSTGFAEPTGAQGFSRVDADGRTETVDVAALRGGVDYIAFDWSRTDLTFLLQDVEQSFWTANN